MRILQIKGDKRVSYPSDCQRIESILFNKGYIATIQQCEILWEKHSNDWSANWLGLKSLSDDQIWDYIKEYIYGEEE